MNNVANGSTQETIEGNEEALTGEQQLGPEKVDQTPPEPKKGVLFVRDSNAKPGKARQHRVITSMHIEVDEVTGEDRQVIDDYIEYNLYNNQNVEMPEAHAMQFLKDKAFVVTNTAGERIRPVEKKDTDVGHIVLEEDEVIVKYYELTQEALYKRCKLYPNSESIKKTSRKAEQIAFLMLMEAQKRKGQRGRGSEGIVSEMPGVESLIDMGGVAPGQVAQKPAVQSAVSKVQA